jgi:hypothetical protein
MPHRPSKVAASFSVRRITNVEIPGTGKTSVGEGRRIKRQFSSRCCSFETNSCWHRRPHALIWDTTLHRGRLAGALKPLSHAARADGDEGTEFQVRTETKRGLIRRDDNMVPCQVCLRGSVTTSAPLPVAIAAAMRPETVSAATRNGSASRCT